MKPIFKNLAILAGGLFGPAIIFGSIYALTGDLDCASCRNWSSGNGEYVQEPPF